MPRKKSKRAKRSQKAKVEKTRFRTSIFKEKRKIKELQKLAEAEEKKLEEEKQARIEAIQKEAMEREFNYRGKPGAEEEAGVGSLIKTGVIVVCSAVVFALVLMTLLKEEKSGTKVAKRPKNQPKKPKQKPDKRPEVRTPINNSENGPELNDHPKPIREVGFVEEKASSESTLSDDLLKKSEYHRSLGDYLAEYDQLRNGNGTDNPYSNYRERQRLETELLERIRALGSDGVPAVVDVLKTLAGHPFQLFLARALAGMDNPEALAATEKLLSKFDNYGVRMQLVKSLPRKAESIDVIGRSLNKVKDANLRIMVLREYAHRTRVSGEASQETVALFRKLALSDSNPTVRAEAIAVIGRRRLEGEREILETIVRKEKHITVRQRAIVSLARTAGAESLPALKDVLESDAEEGVRASAVLGLTLIGADALPALQAVARDDKSEDIRNRAQRAIDNIKFAIENQQKNRLRVGEKEGPPPYSPGGN